MRVLVYIVSMRSRNAIALIIVLYEYPNVKVLVYFVSKRPGKVIARIIVL